MENCSGCSELLTNLAYSIGQAFVVQMIVLYGWNSNYRDRVSGFVHS